MSEQTFALQRVAEYCVQLTLSIKQMIDSPNLARIAVPDRTILEYLERINSRAHETVALV